MSENTTTNEEKMVAGKAGQLIPVSVISRLKAEKSETFKDWITAGKEDAHEYARDEMSYQELVEFINGDTNDLSCDIANYVQDRIDDYSGGIINHVDFEPLAYHDGFCQGLRDFWEEFGNLIKE